MRIRQLAHKQSSEADNSIGTLRTPDEVAALVVSPEAMLHHWSYSTGGWRLGRFG